MQQVNNWMCQATLCLRQGLIYPPLPIPCSSPSTTVPLPITHTASSVPVLFTVIPWYDGGGVYGQYCCDNCICFWALFTIQRTPAKKCKDSMLLYTHSSACTRHTSALFQQVPPSAAPQPAQHHCSLSHLRALRDTGNTCHGSPNLGEGSRRAHTCTTCTWNAKRKGQDYRCTCVCGDSRGCSTSSGDKQFKCIHVHTMCNRFWMEIATLD